MTKHHHEAGRDKAPARSYDYVIVGAGSVVTKDIPDNSLAVGNPAKVIRKLNEED